MNRKYNTLLLSTIIPFVLLLSGMLASCKKDNTTTTDDTVGSNVRVIINNLSPDVYPVRLYVNNVVQNPTTTSTVIGGLQNYATYRFNTPSSYFAVKSSGYPLQLRSTRTVDSILLNVKDTLRSNTYYTLYFTGFLSNSSLGYVLTTDYTLGSSADLPSNGKGKMRYVNATLKLPTNTGYDVYANGTKVFSNILYQQQSAFVEMPAGTYDMKFVYKGASVNTSSNILIDLPNITVQDGHIYTLYSRGVVGRTDSAAVGAGVITNK